MKNMSGRPGAALVSLSTLLLGFAALSVPAASQQDPQQERRERQERQERQGRQERQECRCVDANGTELDGCTCFRAPRVEELLTTYGFNARRPRLGISIDQTQAARHDADGALITDVMEGGPADEAGIREGDVITSISGQMLTESIGASAERDFDLDGSVPVQRLLALAREVEPGEDVEIVYLREGQQQTTLLRAQDLSDSWGNSFTVVRPDFDADQFRDRIRVLTDGVRGFQFPSDGAGFPDAPVAPGMMFRFGGEGLHRDGLDLIEVNPGLGAYFGTDEGVLVAEVDRSSGLGLQAGDVVLRVGDRAVSSPDRFRRILSSYGQEEDINFRILRDGVETTVTGRLRY